MRIARCASRHLQLAIFSIGIHRVLNNLNAELQIIFESNAYLRPNFLLNADFQISKSIFTPCNFSQCWKGRNYCFEVPYLNFFWCNFNYSFGSDLNCYYLLLHLSIYWLYFDNMLTNGQTDWHQQSRVLLLF